MQKKPLLEDQQEAGNSLTENQPQDAALKDTVEEVVEKNQDEQDGFATKVDIRYQRLQRALMKSQEFEKTFADFGDSLKELDKRLDEEDPLTCQFEPLKKIKDQHEVSDFCYSNIFISDYNVFFVCFLSSLRFVYFHYILSSSFKGFRFLILYPSYIQFIVFH